MIFFHTKFRMLLDWTASRIQFHQTSLTNVAKFLLLQVFLNIRHKLFEFQTFMNQTQIIILQTLLYTLQTHIIYIIYPYKYLEICRYHVCLVVSYDRSSGKAHRSK